MNKLLSNFYLNIQGSLKGILVVLFLSCFLTSCSLPGISSLPSIPSVPNWVKPSSALKKVSGIFSRYKSERSDVEKEKVSLDDVPERPVSKILNKRKETISGLKSDSKNARYIKKTDTKSSLVVSKNETKLDVKPSEIKKIPEVPDRGRKVLNKTEESKRNDTLNSRRIITSGKRVKKTTSLISKNSNKDIKNKVLTNKEISRVTEKKDDVSEIGQKPSQSLKKDNSTIISLDDRIAKNNDNLGSNSVRQIFSKMIMQSASKVSNVPKDAKFQATKSRPINSNETTAIPVIRDTYNSSIVTDNSNNNQENSNIKKSEMSFDQSSFSENLNPSIVINFAHDSNALSIKDKQKIRELVKKFSGKLQYIRVVGHASSKTKEMDIINHQLVNFKISIDRAQSVVDELIALSISPSLIKIEAKGSSQPKYFESMPSGEAANRRAEIFIVQSSS